MTAVLVDGSLLLAADGTGIASYTRALSTALQQSGTSVDLLLDSRAKPVPDAPPIALANQVFGTRRVRKGRLAQLQLLWRVRGGFRRHVEAMPVPVEGVELATLPQQLPPHRGVFNADNFLTNARMTFTVSRKFTAVAQAGPHDAMHWTVPAPVFMPGRPNIYTIHDLIPLKFPHFTIDEGGRAAVLHGMIARRADLLLTISERSKQDIIDVLGVPEERIAVARQSVPPLQPFDREDAERVVSTIYGAPPGGYVFFCGAIEPKKNLYRLIEAFTLAGTGQQLLLAGPLGWLYDDVTELLDRVAGAGVRYLGYLPRRHLNALIQCASFFAFPSIYEGFGIPVVEAMHLGTPVLTSNAGSLPEVAGDAALLVDPLNVTEIARAIRQFSADGDLRQEFSRRGTLQAARFSKEQFADDLAAAYRRVGIDIAG